MFFMFYTAKSNTTRIQSHHIHPWLKISTRSTRLIQSLLTAVVFRPTFHEKWDESFRSKSHTPTQHSLFMKCEWTFPVPFKREASERVNGSLLLGSELNHPRQFFYHRIHRKVASLPHRIHRTPFSVFQVRLHRFSVFSGKNSLYTFSCGQSKASSPRYFFVPLFMKNGTKVSAADLTRQPTFTFHEM